MNCRWANGSPRDSHEGKWSAPSRQCIRQGTNPATEIDNSMDANQPNPPTSENAGAPPDFETALARMEAIVFELEEGRIGLAEALARYEEGVGLLRQCFALLETAERRI